MTKWHENWSITSKLLEKLEEKSQWNHNFVAIRRMRRRRRKDRGDVIRCQRLTWCPDSDEAATLEQGVIKLNHVPRAKFKLDRRLCMKKDWMIIRKRREKERKKKMETRHKYEPPGSNSPLGTNCFNNATEPCKELLCLCWVCVPWISGVSACWRLSPKIHSSVLALSVTVESALFSNVFWGTW